MAALYRKPHCNEARYNEVELYMTLLFTLLLVSQTCPTQGSNPQWWGETLCTGGGRHMHWWSGEETSAIFYSGKKKTSFNVTFTGISINIFQYFQESPLHMYANFSGFTFQKGQHKRSAMTGKELKTNSQTLCFKFHKTEPVREKTNNLGSDHGHQVQHKQGSTVTESG